MTDAEQLDLLWHQAFYVNRKDTISIKEAIDAAYWVGVRTGVHGAKSIPALPKPRIMLQVGVEGDLFYPHEEDKLCQEVGCVEQDDDHQIGMRI